MILITEIGEEGRGVVRAQQGLSGLRHLRRDLKTGDRITVFSDPSETIAPPGDAVTPLSPEAHAAQLTSLVGRTVIAANGIVSAWAILYATISGHSLPFVASLFDKWARENVQRERTAKLAREFLQKLPRELEHVENLLAEAETLARERELLVGQPWSLGYLDDLGADALAPVVQGDVAMEREAQFESLFAGLSQLHVEILKTVEAFKLSRDVEKVRVLNRSAILAAEFKFGRKAARPKSGPRHKEWRQSLVA
jgi:hypothetical protein